MTHFTAFMYLATFITAAEDLMTCMGGFPIQVSPLGY